MSIAALPNTANSVTLAADPAHRHVIDSMAWSYSGVPTAESPDHRQRHNDFRSGYHRRGRQHRRVSEWSRQHQLGNAVAVTLDAGGLGITGAHVEWHDENT